MTEHDDIGTGKPDLVVPAPFPPLPAHPFAPVTVTKSTGMVTSRRLVRSLGTQAEETAPVTQPPSPPPPEGNIGAVGGDGLLGEDTLAPAGLPTLPVSAWHARREEAKLLALQARIGSSF